LAENLLDRVDADLEAVPALADLTSRQLIALLHRSHAILRALHAHEILMGMLTDTGRNRMTGASVALVLVGTTGRLERRGHPGAQSDRARTHAAACRQRPCSPGVFGSSTRWRRGQRQRQRPGEASVCVRWIRSSPAAVGTRCTAHAADQLKAG
jgi:hypothetical protein